MIDTKKCMDVFNNYVKNYDMTNSKIKMKHAHTLRVANVCYELGAKLNMAEDKKELLYLMGLLHDIGRFEQLAKHNSLEDKTTMDHGEYGCEILFKDNLIREFIIEDTYDDLIEKTIWAHNKYKIPNSFKEIEKLYARILRDADKIDIFRMHEYERNTYYSTVEKINPKIIENFNLKKMSPYEHVITELDSYVTVFAFIYDINFIYSFEIIKENKYIENIFKEVKVKDSKAKREFNRIKKNTILYIDEQIKEEQIC